MGLIVYGLVFWLFYWGKRHYYLNKQEVKPPIQEDFEVMDAPIKPLKRRIFLTLLLILMMLVLTWGCAWVLYSIGLSLGNKYNTHFDFRPALFSWYPIGLTFMFVYIRPTMRFLEKLIFREEEDYLSYSDIEDEESLRKIKRFKIIARVFLVIGSVFLFDYSIKIDDKNIELNPFWSFYQEEKYTFGQINSIFFYPDIKDNKGDIQTTFHYLVMMKNGFEWQSNSSLNIDSTAFRFLSVKSGVKIDTIGKK